MHDYVVVGAGSSGCVLARRLSDDPSCKVLLVEAGPAKHRSLKVRGPALYPKLWRTPLDWAFSTAPQAHVDGRAMFWPRGKVLGGTSCLNAMVYIRGHRDDYDGWAAAGCAGWGWDDVLPLFRRSEDNARGESAAHGAGGPLRVIDQAVLPVADAFAEATAARCGVRVVDDFNAGVPEGAGRFQVTVRDGARASTAREFLDPIAGRANLEIVTGGHVTGVIVEGGRARGVRVARGGRVEELRAAKEVVLCGGAIGSPHVLLLSGIGPADELRAAGVDVVVDLPGVGRNLQDHLLVGVSYDAPSPGVISQALPRMLGHLARYAFTGRGLIATAPVQAGAFVRSAPDVARADIQFHFTPWALPEPNSDEAHPVPGGRRVAILPGLIYPRSRGAVTLASKDPLAAPRIDPRYFSDDADLAHLVAGVKLTREIAATAPLAAHLGAERFPGPARRDDEALRAAVRERVNTIFHPVGTCAMGNGADAVVDPALRVRGVDGLRVVDASIMPTIVGGNTNAPCIMIAEKAAELILGA